MRVVTALALLVTLVVAATAQGQLCTFNGNTFTLPNFGTYVITNDQYQTYGQYVPAMPSLTGPRLWQMSLCGTAANQACQSGNIQAPVSYIYELNRNDGSKGSCDMGLSSFGGWFQSTAIDAKGNTVPSMNGTFMNVAQNRVAVVAIICGGTTDQLNPVNFPGANNGWYTYPNAAQTVWTWDVVFQFPVPGLCGGPQPPVAPPATPSPGTPVTPQPATPQPPSPPAPAGVCTTTDGAWFKLPTFNGTVAQSVPSAPGLSGSRNWQVSLCGPAAPMCGGSGSTGIVSYVFESDPMSNVCSMALSVQATNWTQVGAGGLNALFTNLEGNLVANVTLSCGPTAALQPLDTAFGGSEKGWLTHRLPNSVADIWVWDMWFATSALPGC